MRILVVVKQKAFLRHFEEVLLALADRGHRIQVAAPAADPMPVPGRLAGRVAEAACPGARTDEWADVIGILRAARSYARYLDPRYDAADKLRLRAFRKLAAQLSGDGRGHLKARCPECHAILRDERLVEPLRQAVAGQPDRLAKLGRLVEAAVPGDAAIDRFLAEAAPDLLLLTPLVTFDSFLPDYVKSARALGIPTATPVFSWDNLSNKALMHEVPDRVLVWNETQRREAVELHGVPPARVEVTGAPRFDPFVRMRPTTDRAAFCAKVGLPADRPILLYLGSSPFVAPEEPAFVRRWVESVRAGRHPDLAAAGILLRPHPRRKKEWRAAGLETLPGVVVSTSPFENADQHLYDCLHHAAAAVELNTSAAIEAALVGTPVFTIRLPELQPGQAGTLHFHYLLEEHGGCVRPADTLEEHVEQLSALLAGEPGAARDRNGPFVSTFVYGGTATPSPTERMVTAIEAAARPS